MKCLGLTVAAWVWAFVAGTAGAQDWPQWRGPHRDGVCPDTTALADTWPAAGPKRLWVSEKIPGGGRGGFGSPVVAGGRVYLYANIRTPAPEPNGLGTVKDALFCLDAADGKTLWCRQYKTPPLANCDNTWTVSSSTPCIAGGRCYFAGADGTLYCLNARDGTEVWTVKPTGGIQNSSPLVTNGLVVLLSEPSYAVHAADGKPVWTQPKAPSRRSSAVPWTCAGKDYLLCNGAGDGEVHCLDAATGALIWTTPGKDKTFPGSGSTVAVAGDVMVAQTDDKDFGLVAYRVAATGAQKLWNIDLTDPAASPIIHNGYVYAVVGHRSVCVGLVDGKIAWNQGRVAGEAITSPVLADGKIYALTNNGNALLMLRATPAKFDLLGKASVGGLYCASPAIAGGRLYLRLGDGIACYDLTAAGAPTAASPPR